MTRDCQSAKTIRHNDMFALPNDFETNLFEDANGSVRSLYRKSLA